MFSVEKAAQWTVIVTAIVTVTWFTVKIDSRVETLEKKIEEIPTASQVNMTVREIERFEKIYEKINSALADFQRSKNPVGGDSIEAIAVEMCANSLREYNEIVTERGYEAGGAPSIRRMMEQLNCQNILSGGE